MKKAFVITLILLAALILSACGTQGAIKPEDVTATPAQAPVPAPSPSPDVVSTPGVMPEPSAAAGTDSFGVPEEINGYAVFADIAILSDPPEGGIDMFEAIRRLSLEEDPLTIMPGNDKSEFAYRYEGVIEIEGEDDECYDIFLLMKDVNGMFSEGTDLERYAVSTGGTIYIFLEESGEWTK